MRELYTTVTVNVHYVAGPMILFSIYRLIVCRAELSRIKSLREKKGSFRSCRSQYGEMGAELCMLPVFVVAFLLPRLWPLWLAAAAAAGILGYRAGTKKAAPIDAHWRQVGLAMQKTDPETAVETREPEALLSAADFTAENTASAAPEENDTVITEENT